MQTDEFLLEHAAQAAVVLEQNERIAHELHDRVISHLYGSALRLASVLSRNRLDEENERRLQDGIDEGGLCRSEVALETREDACLVVLISDQCRG